MADRRLAAVISGLRAQSDADASKLANWLQAQLDVWLCKCHPDGAPMMLTTDDGVHIYCNRCAIAATGVC